MKVSTFAALGREVATYLEQFAIVAGVFVGVAFVVNLLYSIGDNYNASRHPEQCNPECLVDY